MRTRRQDGFTLLELIVAAGILALIAVFSWRGLDTLIREREAIAASQGAIDVLQRSFARIERDALLASDAQLDDSGTMRLLAGPAVTDDVDTPTVEYRLVSGTLTRSVGGVDRPPQVVLDGIEKLSIEAWAPAPGGGNWVRVKGAATEAPRPAGNAPAGANPSQPGTSTNAADVQQNNVPTSSTLTRGNPANATAAPPAAPSLSGPVVAAATGIRMTFVRADGLQVSRAFMIGGG